MDFFFFPVFYYSLIFNFLRCFNILLITVTGTDCWFPERITSVLQTAMGTFTWTCQGPCRCCQGNQTYSVDRNIWGWWNFHKRCCWSHGFFQWGLNSEMNNSSIELSILLVNRIYKKKVTQSRKIAETSYTCSLKPHFTIRVHCWRSIYME